MKTRPIQEVRFGTIKDAIWENETPTGIRYSVTFSRLYREADRWKAAANFGRDDLLLLGKVADQAHAWILTRNQNPQATTPATKLGAASPRKTSVAADAEVGSN